jgi:anti-sigma-K factor RskA
MKLQGQKLESVAGAYVLGTLPLRARRRFEKLLREDVNARRAWLQWEERLSGLGEPAAPVRPAAGTLQAILVRIGAGGARHGVVARRWAVAAALLLVVVAALFMVRPPGSTPVYTAQVRGESGAALWEISAPGSAQRLDVRALRDAAVPDGRDYELWALLPGGAAPVSLGVVPRSGQARRVLSGEQRAALLAASQLALSDEPVGGSPTGAPTGAVLFVMDLKRSAG